MIALVNNTIGRKGFLSYLKALDGSNIVKVVPAEGNKGLRVVCGANTSYLPDNAWVTEKLKPFTVCEVRISPHNAISPNLGGLELAETLSRVIPFTERGKEARQTFRCVKFASKDGKLILTASDGYRLCEVSLNFDGEIEALIEASELRGLISALRKAKRVKVSTEAKTDVEGGLMSKALMIDTEVISYKLRTEDFTYPDYEKVFPNEFVATAFVDTKAMLKACQSLSALWLDNQSRIKLTIVSGMVRLEAKEDRGKADIEADTEGEGSIGVSAQYLAQTLRACGNGIVELKIANANSPVTFSLDGIRALVMPMAIPEAKPEAKAETKVDAVTEAEKVVKATPKPKGKKAKRGKAKEPKPKEPVAVA